MVQLGYALSTGEHCPNDLVRDARPAEEAGFPFALISDHYPVTSLPRARKLTAVLAAPPGA